MEQAFGQDFSAVRVHVGTVPPASGARALTHGNAIHFAPGQYDPGTPPGLRLIARQLAHVVQQREGRVRPPPGAARPPGGPVMVTDARLDAEAERLAVRAVSLPDEPAHPVPRPAVARPNPGGASAIQPLVSGKTLKIITTGLVIGGGLAYAAWKTKKPQVTFATIGTVGDPQGVRRVSPGRGMDVRVTVTGGLWQLVTLAVVRSTGNSGGATLSVTSLRSTATTTLRPTEQTNPNERLQLVATCDGTVVGRSNEFSVAAWPVAVRVKEFAPRQPGQPNAVATINDATTFGLRVINEPISDSGDIRDLDQVSLSEIVAPGPATGAFVGGNRVNSGYRPANQSRTDKHSKNKNTIYGAMTIGSQSYRRSPGYSESHQHFIFKCARTGVSDVPVRDSGFAIVYTSEVVDRTTGQVVELSNGVTRVGDANLSVRWRVVKKAQAVGPVQAGLGGDDSGPVLLPP